MRGLLGGLIGAAASAAAWLAAEHFQQANYGWMVSLVGLVTGLCVYKASSVSSSGFARGALAIILTLAAILGGRQVYAKIMQSTSTGAEPAPMIESIEAEAEDAEGEASEPVNIETVLPVADEELAGFGKADYTKPALKNNLQNSDMLWLCVAALAAYLTGKGGDKAGVSEEEGAEATTPPVEPQESSQENESE